MSEEQFYEDVKLVDTIADLLKRFKIMTPLITSGQGTVEGPASFQIFGRGPANRQLILDVFLRILVATQEFENPVHCSRTYKLTQRAGTHQLAQGYTIAGVCKNKKEVEALMEALDISDWYTAKSQVNEALFFVPAGDGKTVVPSGPRNIPASSANSPDGAKGVWPTMGGGGPQR